MSTTRPLKVFLCHATVDKPAVRKLYRYLDSKGMDPWLDAEKLLPGESWELEIPKALLASDVILVCLSKNSINKEGYVQKEIAFALDKAKEKLDESIFIIPAKLEVCDVPARLSRYQWVDLYHEGGRKRLMLSLNKRAAQLGPAVEQASISDDTLERQKIELNKKKLVEVQSEETREIKSEKVKLKSVQKKKPDNLSDQNENVEKISLPLDDAIVSRADPSPKLFPIALGGFSLLVIFGFFIAVAIVIAFNVPLFFNPTSTQTPANTKLHTPTLKTASVSPTPQITETITLIPTLGSGSIMKNEKDDASLVYVPEGVFTMGSDDSSQTDEKPAHVVYTDAFWINQNEVTNKQYAVCVDSKTCTLPYKTRSNRHTDYYGNIQYDQFPVIYISWHDAVTYCEWAGGRLPSEAEWEKAARGTDERIYPWGDDKPNNSLLNWGVNDTTEVGSYPKGASPYGVNDMAGNVSEWVNDWWGYRYLVKVGEITYNPQGPSIDYNKVVRGGSWATGDFVTTTFRSFSDPTDPTATTDYKGFRCVFDAKSQ